MLIAWWVELTGAGTREIFQSDLICDGEFPSRPLIVEHKIFTGWRFSNFRTCVIWIRQWPLHPVTWCKSITRLGHEPTQLRCLWGTKEPSSAFFFEGDPTISWREGITLEASHCQELVHTASLRAFDYLLQDQNIPDTSAAAPPHKAWCLASFLRSPYQWWCLRGCHPAYAARQTLSRLVSKWIPLCHLVT